MADPSLDPGIIEIYLDCWATATCGDPALVLQANPEIARVEALKKVDERHGMSGALLSTRLDLLPLLLLDPIISIFFPRGPLCRVLGSSASPHTTIYLPFPAEATRS
jgi:hypothetical protein